LEVAAPVLYTAVVLLSVRFFKRRGVILVGVGCIALTLASDFLTPPGGAPETGFINTIISLLAIAMTTYLSVKIETERAAAYDARAQLEHVGRVTVLGELTASIAHEVNQPLAAVVINGSACTRWLSDHPPNLEEAKLAIGRIVKDANRASEIIAQVRALTKKTFHLNERVDVNDIIRGTVTLVEGELAKHQISLHTELSDDQLQVRGDPVQLQQMILNLVLNAIEAMSGAPEGERELIITCATNAEGVRVLIRDTGRGLVSENLDRIFDAFYTTKPEGMGMGLTISRSIVEAHGGRIWATPNPRGATFQFVLPADGTS
jgi:signal transduction histidine kinase